MKGYNCKCYEFEFFFSCLIYIFFCFFFRFMLFLFFPIINCYRIKQINFEWARWSSGMEPDCQGTLDPKTAYQEVKQKILIAHPLTTC